MVVDVVIIAVARDERIRLTLSTNRGAEALGQDALDLLELGLGGPLAGDALQEAVGHDLAVADVRPKLFLSGLAMAE